MQELVSIIMPAYNAASYIAQAVRSVLEQSYSAWELVIFDDGSTDETARIANEFAISDSRVKVISSGNLGQGRARNAAMRSAHGVWVAFLDADDVWVQSKLTKQLQVAHQTGADVLFSDGWIFSEDELHNQSQTFGTLTGKFSGVEMFQLLFVKNRIPMPSVLARRSVLDAVGLFEGDEQWNRNCEDYELWLRLADYGAVFYGMDENLVRYRHRTDSASNKGQDFTGRVNIRWHNSRSLEAMIAVCEKHGHSALVTPREARHRQRDLHRELLATLLEEGKNSEARRCIRRLISLEGWGGRLIMQCALTYFAPSWYNAARGYFQYARQNDASDHIR